MALPGDASPIKPRNRGARIGRNKGSKSSIAPPFGEIGKLGKIPFRRFPISDPFDPVCEDSEITNEGPHSIPTLFPLRSVLREDIERPDILQDVRDDGAGWAID